jgi:hypothetical protein
MFFDGVSVELLLESFGSLLGDMDAMLLRSPSWLNVGCTNSASSVAISSEQLRALKQA